MKQNPSKISMKRIIIASSLMVLTFIFLSFMSHGRDIPSKKPFSTFPKKIGEWIGQESFFDQKIYEILGVEDSVLISYRDPEGKEVQLYVGYYDSQREGDLIHSPKHCMPGAGWEITQTSLEEMTLPGSKRKTIKVIKLILEKGIHKQVVLYWFQSRGRFISSEYLQKIYLVWDAIFKNRTDGSFVRLIAPVHTKGMDYTLNYLKAFAQQLIPVLEEYIPGEEDGFSI